MREQHGGEAVIMVAGQNLAATSFVELDGL